jgi:hypothetical protein
MNLKDDDLVSAVALVIDAGDEPGPAVELDSAAPSDEPPQAEES